MYGGGSGGQSYGQPPQYNWQGNNQFDQYGDSNELSRDSRQQSSYGSLGQPDPRMTNFGSGLPPQDGTKPVHDMYSPSGGYYTDYQRHPAPKMPKNKTVSRRSSANSSKISKTSTRSRAELMPDKGHYEAIDTVRQIKSEIQELERDLGYIFRGFATVVPFYDLAKGNSSVDTKTIKKKTAQSVPQPVESPVSKKPNKYVQDFMQRNNLETLDVLGVVEGSKKAHVHQPELSLTAQRPQSGSRKENHTSGTAERVQERMALVNQPVETGPVRPTGFAHPQSSQKRENAQADHVVYPQEHGKKVAKDLYRRQDFTSGGGAMVSNASGHSFGEPTSFGNTYTQGFGNTQLQNTREEIGFDSGIQSIQGSQLSKMSDKSTSKRKEEFEKFKQNFFGENRGYRSPDNRLSEGNAMNTGELEQRERMFTRGEGYEMKPGFGTRKFK